MDNAFIFNVVFFLIDIFVVEVVSFAERLKHDKDIEEELDSIENILDMINHHTSTSFLISDWLEANNGRLKEINAKLKELNEYKETQLVKEQLKKREDNHE